MQQKDFDRCLQGTNSPPSVELKDCLVIQDGAQPKDLDVDIITGRFRSCKSKESLLLMRFYNVKHEMSQDTVNMMHNTILRSLCERDGFEAGRTGGSSGPPMANEIFFDFLARETSFPRAGWGVKFCKGATRAPHPGDARISK